MLELSLYRRRVKMLAGILNNSRNREQLKKPKWKSYVTDRRKVAAPGLLAALAVCFIFFIYAPLELYVSNQTEFWFDFYKILKAVLQNNALFFGLNVLGILLAACISKVFCRFVTAAELVVLLT